MLEITRRATGPQEGHLSGATSAVLRRGHELCGPPFFVAAPAPWRDRARFGPSDRRCGRKFFGAKSARSRPRTDAGAEKSPAFPECDRLVLRAVRVLQGFAAARGRPKGGLFGRGGEGAGVEVAGPRGGRAGAVLGASPANPGESRRGPGEPPKNRRRRGRRGGRRKSAASCSTGARAGARGARPRTRIPLFHAGAANFGGPHKSCPGRHFPNVQPDKCAIWPRELAGFRRPFSGCVPSASRASALRFTRKRGPCARKSRVSRGRVLPARTYLQGRRSIVDRFGLLERRYLVRGTRGRGAPRGGSSCVRGPFMPHPSAVARVAPVRGPRSAAARRARRAARPRRARRAARPRRAASARALGARARRAARPRRAPRRAAARAPGGAVYFQEIRAPRSMHAARGRSVSRGSLRGERRPAHARRPFDAQRERGHVLALPL